MIQEFDGIEIPCNWQELLEEGITHFYSDGCCILNYKIYNGILVINSISLKNSNFPPKMIKNIIKIAKAYKNVIIASSVLSIKSYMERHGFLYNYDKKQYEKGISWE